MFHLKKLINLLILKLKNRKMRNDGVRVTGSNAQVTSPVKLIASFPSDILFYFSVNSKHILFTSLLLFFSLPNPIQTRFLQFPRSHRYGALRFSFLRNHFSELFHTCGTCICIFFHETAISCSHSLSSYTDSQPSRFLATSLPSSGNEILTFCFH